MRTEIFTDDELRRLLRVLEGRFEIKTLTFITAYMDNDQEAIREVPPSTRARWFSYATELLYG